MSPPETSGPNAPARTEPSPAAEARFGARALALEPRAHAPRPGAEHDVDLLVREAALDPDVRRELAALPSVRLSASPGPAGDETWLRIRGARAELRELARSAPDAACLLAAHDAACAPPAPPRLMGIVNVTPDSFSDGGRFLDPPRAIEHGLGLVDEGAELLDVGGESTRPGSEGVTEEEERRRVLPVIEGLRARTDVPLSIDTTKAGVARAALDAGATMVNDVSAGRFDPDLLEVVAERGCGIVLMHMLGRPRDMQVAPAYGDVVVEVLAHLRARVAACLKTGIALPKIVLDPGIGFGKRLVDNLDLVRGLPSLRSLGRPILLGVSRKSFLGQLSGRQDPAARLEESIAAVTAGILFGAEIFRVHDVRSMSPALRVAAALADNGGDSPPRTDSP